MPKRILRGNPCGRNQKEDHEKDDYQHAFPQNIEKYIHIIVKGNGTLLILLYQSLMLWPATGVTIYHVFYIQ